MNLLVAEGVLIIIVDEGADEEDAREVVAVVVTVPERPVAVRE